MQTGKKCAEEDNARLAHIDELLSTASDPSNGGFLLAEESYCAIRRLEAKASKRFRNACDAHKQAVERHIAPTLLTIAEGRQPTTEAIAALIRIVAVDPIRSAFRGRHAGIDPSAETHAGIESLRRVWPNFRAWWATHFEIFDPVQFPIVDLWQFFLPLAQWIISERATVRPYGMFMVAFNGSPGAGKTVTTGVLTVLLNSLLDPTVDGRAVARSGDDWYLSKADREPLRACGFDPGRPGLSNRAPPGTQDLGRLRRNIAELDASTPESRIYLANFDKQSDDIPLGNAATVTIDGKVAVFLFDLWFAGAGTTSDPSAQDSLLRQNIAAELYNWKPIFDRIDALFAFNWPSFDSMVEERETQEQLIELKRGKRGMSAEDIVCFMDYMINKCWDWDNLSPLPDSSRITFRLWRDSNHRIIAIEKGGLAWTNKTTSTAKYPHKPSH